MIAHLVSEWAMDEHVGADIQPADVLEEAGGHAVQFVARGFRCDEMLARRALGVLARSDRFLRRSRVPALCRGAVNTGRFDLYLGRTVEDLAGLEAALAGRYEDWCGSDPEGSGGHQGADRRAREHIARIVQAEDHA